MASSPSAQTDPDQHTTAPLDQSSRPSQGHAPPVNDVSSPNQSQTTGTTDHSINGSSSQSSQSMPPTRAEIEARPWQYVGYDGFTKWMSSSTDFFLLRRFDQMHAWVQRDWQWEITKLEQELKAVNLQCQSNHGRNARADRVDPRLDPMPRRVQILKELRPLLKAYDEFVLGYSSLRERPPANYEQTESTKNWFYNNDYAIDSCEQDPCIEVDVIPIIETKFEAQPYRKKPVLRTLFEILAITTQRMIGSISKRPSTVTSYYYVYNVDNLLLFFGLGFLLGPMWWLNYVANNERRLGIISGFVTLFTVLLAMGTTRSPFEILAGTAAYAAVLIVFLQQSGQPGL